MRRGLLVLILLLVLAACGKDDPSKEVVQGDALFSNTFDQPGTWEEGAYPVDAETPESTLTIEDGRYVITHESPRSSSFIWGMGGDDAQNEIIEVTAEQVGGDDNNLYGVACRLSENNEGSQNGYALLISGDGHYGIAILKNRSLDFLLDWHQSDAIKQGRAVNTIRAVCVDNYLAIYANGTFLGDVTDDTYPRAGQVGLVAGVTQGASVSVAFDDLAVYAGSLE